MDATANAATDSIRVNAFSLGHLMGIAIEV
jgi:hypothetical protein